MVPYNRWKNYSGLNMIQNLIYGDLLKIKDRGYIIPEDELRKKTGE